MTTDETALRDEIAAALQEVDCVGCWHGRTSTHLTNVVDAVLPVIRRLLASPCASCGGPITEPDADRCGGCWQDAKGTH